MIKFLFNNFKDFPGIGNPIKAAYVGHLVKNLVKKTEQDESKAELKNLAADETEEFVNNKANELFDENIGKIITQNNIPQDLVNPLKEKAIDQLCGILRDKVMKSVDTEQNNQ